MNNYNVCHNCKHWRPGSSEYKDWGMCAHPDLQDSISTDDDAIKWLETHIDFGCINFVDRYTCMEEDE